MLHIGHYRLKKIKCKHECKPEHGGCHVIIRDIFKGHLPAHFHYFFSVL